MVTQSGQSFGREIPETPLLPAIAGFRQNTQQDKILTGLTTRKARREENGEGELKMLPERRHETR